MSASGAFLPLFASVVPLVNAALGLGLADMLRLAEGDAILFVTLAASASYIAVPAAMRMAMPEANPSLYVSMALALTFPFNIVIGIKQLLILRVCRTCKKCSPSINLINYLA